MISATEMYATTNDIQKAASKSTEKTNEFLKNQIDRYHDINVELQKVTNTLERLSLVESRMIGNSLIKNLQKQTNELQKQIKLSKEKQKLQYDEARELKGRLKGYGTTFEENTITNYAEILKQYQDAHNALAISGGSDKQIEAAKKTYENLKEDIEKYEQLVLEDIPNLYDEMLEDEYERMEKQIQMYNEQMQIKLDAKEAIRDLNVWASEVFDEFKLFNDDIAHAVDGFKIVVDRSNRSMQNVDSYYNAADSGTAELDLEKFNHIIENVALMNQKDIRSDYASTDQYGNIILNQTKAIEDLDAAEEALKTSMNDLLQEANNVIEAWNDGFDAYLTKTDELIDVFDEAIRQLNHAAKVNELLYGKSAKASVTFTQGQIDQNNQKLLAMNIQRGELESEYKRLLADGNDTQARVVKESYDKLVSDMDSIVEDNLQLIQENITNRVNAYYEDLQASTLTQGEWDMSKTSHENRYDRNQQQLKLDAFDAKIEADKAGMDAKTQARLQKFQNEELKRLREKDVLTKHEYERAEKRYELLLKQIALEESQNNKTKMRLRRDSQGNYSYQYVADDEDVDDKKEEIASKKEEIYTFDRDYLTDMTDALQKMLTENGADLAKMILAYQQAGRTPEAYSQLQAYLEQLTKNYGLTVDDFLNAKNFLIDDLRDIYPDTSSLIDQNGFDVNTIASLIGGTAGDIQNMDVNTLLNALQTAQGGSNYLLETIYGINGEIFNVSDAIANAVQTGYFDVSSLGDLTTEILAKADTDINTTLTNGHQNLELINGDLSSIYDMTAGIAEQVAAVTAEWANVALELENNLTAIQNIIDKINSELILAIQDAIATAAKLKQEAASIEWSEPNYSGIGEAGTDSSGITSSTGGLGSDSSSSAVSTTGSKNLTFWQWLRGMSDFTDSMDGTLTHAIDNYASKSHMTPGARDSMKDNPNESMKRIYEQDKKNGFMMYKDISGFNPGEATKFATGGYTGNDEGLAMLHKKELVLNAEDTENMLKMLEIVRNMKNSVLEQQQTNSLSFDNFANKMLSFLNEASTVKLNKSTSVPGRSLSENENSNFQQTVNITAEFPNVTNRNEIELALQNLSSVAAQSAFSTRR